MWGLCSLSTHEKMIRDMIARSILRQAIVKVAQRCNLNCDYCYVYNMGDSSWKSRPKFIDITVIQMLANRIKEHCADNLIEKFHVELHGGEPLLYGKERMAALLETFISTVGRNRIKFSIQTNGLLLDENWVDLLTEFEVNTGISIDGPPSSQSLRVDHKGNDSTQQLLNVIKHLRKTRPNFRPGVLTVLTDYTDIRYLIDWFPTLGINSFDILFPLGNYVAPPIGLSNKPTLTKNLINGFDYWYAKGINAPQIRLFELLIEGFLGHEVVLDSLGGDLRALCVIESDGGIGFSDVIRFCGSDFKSDRIDIYNSKLSEHVDHYKVDKLPVLSNKCQNCDVVNACGGGYLPDRFDGTTFDNPTYYCDVMLSLCRHIRMRLSESIPETAWVEGRRLNG